MIIIDSFIKYFSSDSFLIVPCQLPLIIQGNYNQEFERFRGNSIVDERNLREIYLPAFETVVKEAHPWTVMCSYNRLNGIYASEHEELLRETLKEEWDFEGVAVSDWGSVHNIYHPIQGGLDLEMPGPAKYFGLALVTPLEGLLAKVGDHMEIFYEPGYDNQVNPKAVEQERIMHPDGVTKGLKTVLFNNLEYEGEPDLHEWVAELGKFKVLIGSCSRDIRLCGSFELCL